MKVCHICGHSEVDDDGYIVSHLSCVLQLQLKLEKETMRANMYANLHKKAVESLAVAINDYEARRARESC